MGLVDGLPTEPGVATHGPTRHWENHNTPGFFVSQTNSCRGKKFVNEFAHSYISVHTCAIDRIPGFSEFTGLVWLILQILSSCLLKDCAANTFEIRAVRIQIAWPRGKVVREQYETFGVQRAGNVDLLDRGL